MKTLDRLFRIAGAVVGIWYAGETLLVVVTDYVPTPHHVAFAALGAFTWVLFEMARRIP